MQNRNFQETKNTDTQDIKYFITRIIKRWKIIIPCIIAALVLVYFINKDITPVYQLSTTILVNNVSTPEDILEMELPGNKMSSIDNEMEIVKSRLLIEQTVRSLGLEITYFADHGSKKLELYSSLPFIVDYDTSHVQLLGSPIQIHFQSEDQFRLEIKSEDIKTIDYRTDETEKILREYKFSNTFRLGDWIETDYFRFRLLLPAEESGKRLKGENYYFTFNNINQLVSSYRSALKIETNASIMELYLPGTNKSKVADFLNSLAQKYIEFDLHEKNAIGRNALDFIDSELVGMKDSLEEAETNFAEFRSTKRVIDLGVESSNLIQQLLNMENERATAELTNRYLLYLQNYLRTHDNYADIVSPSMVGVNETQIMDILQKLRDQSSEASSYSSIIGKKTDEVLQKKKDEMQYTKRVLEENVKNALSSNEITISQLSRRIGQLEGQLRNVPKNEQEYIDLKRKFELNDKLVSFLSEKRAETGITIASNSSNHRILDKAKDFGQPPLATNKSLNYVIGLIAGLLIPVIGVVLFDVMDNKVRTLDQVTEGTTIPILGTVPSSHGEPSLLVKPRPQSVMAEAFRFVKTNLQYFIRNIESPVIMVTSASFSEGKTFCSGSLANILALGNQKVALIETDLRKPRMVMDLKITAEKGLSDYLSYRADLDDILTTTHDPNLDLVVAGPVPPNPAELLGSKRFDELVSKLKERYDYIVLDSSPLGLVADSPMVAKNADIMIYMIRQNVTKVQSMAVINEYFARGELKNIGILVNDLTSGSNLNYGYGYGYGNSSEKKERRKGLKLFSRKAKAKA
ncbi:MAG: polysaccharide biosynthesis tyrosine autokinase [Bacteroidia bacterium]